jgi:hypothetical protein
MAYIIMKQERHPDRCIDDFYGPFDTWQEANEIATKLFESPSNFNAPYSHYLYDFDVRTLEPAPL